MLRSAGHDLAWMLRLFDFPDPNITSGARVDTTVPLQQLFVLNSEFIITMRGGRGHAIAGFHPPGHSGSRPGPPGLPTALWPGRHRAASSSWDSLTFTPRNPGRLTPRSFPPARAAGSVYQALLAANEFLFID